MMDCHRFEIMLEELGDGALPSHQRQACEAHAAGCARCHELLVLATLPVEDAEFPDLVHSVLAQTSAGLCESTSLLLPDLVDGALPPDERSLVAEHVAGCADCGALAAVLTALRRELPRLSQVRPDDRFVEDVLRRTLPVNVQLRRWWARTWPRWLHRPRFASEAAYVGSLVLVLVFATPGSPLEAVPQKALAVARQPVPEEGLVPKELRTRLAAAKAAVETSSARTIDKWTAAGSESAARAEELVVKVGDGLATFRDEAASLLGRSEEDTTSESPDSTEEIP